MTQTKKFRPSPAMVIACIALFATTAGTALAAALPQNSVRSAQIVNGAVKTVDLGKDAVRSSKIADGTVSAADLGTDSVDSEEIAENAVTSVKVAPESLTAADLGPASVGSSEVADESLTQNDLGPNSVGSSELQASSVRASELAPISAASKTATIAPNSNGSVVAQCPAGTTVISGGGVTGSYQVPLVGATRSGNGWIAYMRNTAAGNTTITAYAYCLAA